MDRRAFSNEQLSCGESIDSSQSSMIHFLSLISPAKIAIIRLRPRSNWACHVSFLYLSRGRAGSHSPKINATQRDNLPQNTGVWCILGNLYPWAGVLDENSGEGNKGFARSNSRLLPELVALMVCDLWWLVLIWQGQTSANYSPQHFAVSSIPKGEHKTLAYLAARQCAHPSGKAANWDGKWTEESSYWHSRCSF